jgi:hypothetical protein
MKKTDLKSGMLVEMRNGEIHIVFGEVLISNKKYGWTTIESLDDCLLMIAEHCEDFDIMRVSNIKTDYNLKPHLWTLENITNDLLWQRPEPKEMIEIDGVEYEVEEVKEALEAMRVKLSKEKPIDPPKKKHVIEYDVNKYLLFPTHSEQTNGSLLSEMIKGGRYRKTKENADYSLQRNKRANLLEALVEDLQGELGVGEMVVYFDLDEKEYRYDNGGFGRQSIEEIIMKEETAIKICEILNTKGVYEL